ncbi:MAG: isochorismatase family protein, partial [Candidatus Aminicenantales bacterium]
FDVQNAYLPFMDEKDKKSGLEMINSFIALFRATGDPIIRVYHTDPKMGPAPGSEAFDFSKTIAVRDDDPKVVKNYPDAFNKTELDKLLKDKGCNTLFLCGLSAVGCVLATYNGALNLDYQVFLAKDALISHDAALTKAVQEFSQTIDFYALKLLLENICR